MSINRAEATRLSRECLPKMLGLAQGGKGGKEEAAAAVALLSERDVAVKSLCRLWAGMGYIYQITVQLPGGSKDKNRPRQFQFIVKRVVPPPARSRSFGDKRKAASYLIEASFYERIAPSLIDDHGLAIPTPHRIEREGGDKITICMSRVTGSHGYLSSDRHVHAVLDWLATLHAATWGPSKVDGYVERGWVQPVGSYWNLGTRPDEHDSMTRRGWEGRLKLAARAIDERLRRDEMQCCIHGDAKDANMLFEDDCRVTMYDFQYCGKAPPSVDLAYFLCVAVGDTDGEYVKYYHRQLVDRLDETHSADCHRPTLKELEESVALALCDFQRFMSGWGQWGSDISSEVIEVLDCLDGGTNLGSEDAYREAMLREFG